ncbi:MAG: ABC transporter permease [Flavobacteriales bacterium]|nr:ABC transporter permease [Flavobacteriales bacterium]
MNKILLIIKREFWTRVRKPSFLIMTILGPLLLAGGVSLIVFLGMQESGEQKVLVVDPAGHVTDRLRGSADVKYQYSPLQLDDSLFVQSNFTLRLTVDSNVHKLQAVTLHYKQPPSINVQTTISKDVERVIEADLAAFNHLDSAAYQQIKNPITMKVADIKQADKDSFIEVKALLGFGFGYVMFFFIFLYGVQVMRGVMEEKQNRVVEVLISSVKPFQLMMGKIVGVALVGLVQFLLWMLLSFILIMVGLAIAGLSIDGEALANVQMTTELQQQMGGSMQLDAAKADGSEKMTEMFTVMRAMPWAAIIGLFVFYFLGGYLLYSSLFAAVGSAVDSETDSQQFMMPITIPLMIAVFIAQMAVYNPGSPAVFWCSIIPFTSPIVMMIRIATGNAFEHPWELLLSMVMLVATFIFTTWLAGRIYRTGILMYGKKVTWKELGKWLFYRG